MISKNAFKIFFSPNFERKNLRVEKKHFKYKKTITGVHSPKSPCAQHWKGLMAHQAIHDAEAETEENLEADGVQKHYVDGQYTHNKTR